MSRPKLDTDTARTARVPNARLTPDERALILQRAKEAGLNPTEYVRRACLEGKIVVRESGMAINVATFRELNAIGNNLNQLTRREHIHGEREYDRLHQMLDMLEAATLKIVGAD